MLKKKLGIEAIEIDWHNEENLVNYFKIPSTLIIPEGVKRIGYHTFWGCESLDEVVIPGSVKEIEKEAFYWCSVKVLTISEGVEKICDSAFTINVIKELVIPGSVKEIGFDAFAHNILEKVVISEGVERICDYAFAGCEWLEKIEIPGSVKEIGYCAFGGCERAEIVIDRSPNEEDLVISSSAFEDCKNVKYAKEKTRG